MPYLDRLRQGWGQFQGGLDSMMGAQGIMGEQSQVDPQKDARLALAATLLSGTHSGQGFNDLFGKALLAGQSARQGAQMQQQQMQEQQSQQEYRKAQMAAMGQRQESGPSIGALSPEKYTPESIAKFQRSKNYGDLVPVATATSGTQNWVGNVNPGDFDPKSIEDYRRTVDPTTGIGDFSKLKRVWAPPTVSFQSTPGIGSAIVDPGNRLGGGPITQVTTPEQERAASAAQAQAQKEAEARGSRSATFNADIAKIDDEITRTQRLLNEFKAGRYQTGFFAGMLPNVRTAAQDLQADTGKDVLAAISSATFGALSEGERAFLRNIGISESKSEKANINVLEKREEQLRKTRERLLNQNSADSAGPPVSNTSGWGSASVVK